MVLHQCPVCALQNTDTLLIVIYDPQKCSHDVKSFFTWLKIFLIHIFLKNTEESSVEKSFICHPVLWLRSLRLRKHSFAIQCFGCVVHNNRIPTTFEHSVKKHFVFPLSRLSSFTFSSSIFSWLFPFLISLYCLFFPFYLFLALSSFIFLFYLLLSSFIFLFYLFLLSY